MQRTVLFYAVAAATLIGALLLVPTIAEPVPPPLPPEPEPVVEVKASSVTRLSYGDALLTIDARLDRGSLLRSGDEPIFLDVTVSATDAAGARPPVATLLVVDRSGSMAGDPIEHARRAAASLVSRLQDGDRVALVSYGTDVTVDLPWTTLDATTRTRALRSIARLEEGGGTNIDGGLKRARGLVATMGPFDGVVRVLMLSDGRANEGERRVDRLALHADELRAAGATVSTLGLGLDYNEALLERLSVAGSGRYHYLRHAKDLSAILDDELRHATRVIARGVKLVLDDDPDGLAFAEAPGATVDRAHGRTTLVLGDLAAGEQRRLLVKLVPGAKVRTAASLSWLAPEVTYRAGHDGAARLLAHRADAFRVLITDDALAVEQSRREEVRVRVLQVTSSVALTRSMEAYASGDVATARRVLSENRVHVEKAAKETKNAALRDEAAQLEQVLQRVNSAAPASAEAQDMVKYQRARAFDLRR